MKAFGAAVLVLGAMAACDDGDSESGPTSDVTAATPAATTTPQSTSAPTASATVGTTEGPTATVDAAPPSSGASAPSTATATASTLPATTPPTTPPPPPPPVSTIVAGPLVTIASDVIGAVLAETPAVVSGDDELALLDDSVTGAALAEIEVRRDEFAEFEWTLVGEPTLDQLTILEDRSDEDPPTMVVQVCLDSSAVEVRDETGEVVSSENPARSLNIYGLEQIDGAWVVVTHTFPDIADC